MFPTFHGDSVFYGESRTTSIRQQLEVISFKLYIRKIKFASLILQTQFYYLYFANRPVGNFSLLSQDFFFGRVHKN